LSALLVEFDGCADFGVLELDELVFFVAFAVPFCENLQGFFVAVFVAEPSRETVSVRYCEDSTAPTWGSQA
jgi:hypothetical protein